MWSNRLVDTRQNSSDYFDIMNFRNSICGPTRSHQLTLPCNIRDGKRWDLPLRGLLVLMPGAFRPIVTPMPNSTPIPSLPLYPHPTLPPRSSRLLLLKKFLKDKDMQNHDCLGQSMNGTTYRGCAGLCSFGSGEESNKNAIPVLPHVIRNKRVGKGRRVDSVQSHSPLRNHRVSFTV